MSSQSEKIIPTGAKFGRLTVLGWKWKKYEYRGKLKRTRRYLCACECGTKTVAWSTDLLTGRHKSCGCYSRDVQRKRLTKPDNYAQKYSVLKNYRRSALTRGITFNLTQEQFFDLIQKPCFYCGAIPQAVPPYARRLKGKTEFKYNGVDRVDNTQGYTVENSVPACDTCNNSKSTLSLKAWSDWIVRVYNHLKGSTTSREAYTQASGNGDRPFKGEDIV